MYTQLIRDVCDLRMLGDDVWSPIETANTICGLASWVDNLDKLQYVMFQAQCQYMLRHEKDLFTGPIYATHVGPMIPDVQNYFVK